MSAKIWLGRDNDIVIQLLTNGKALADHTAVTRVIVDLNEGTYTIDSDSDPTWFDLTNTDKIIFNFGLVTGIPAASYSAEIVIYDPTYTSGLIWVEDWSLTFE